VIVLIIEEVTYFYHRVLLYLLMVIFTIHKILFKR